MRTQQYIDLLHRALLLLPLGHNTTDLESRISEKRVTVVISDSDSSALACLLLPSLFFRYR